MKGAGAICAIVGTTLARWLYPVLDGAAHRLTFILYGLLIAPGMIACLVTMGAHQVVPRLGLDVPAYLLIVFLIAPVTLVPWHSQRHAAATAANSGQQWASASRRPAMVRYS